MVYSGGMNGVGRRLKELRTTKGFTLKQIAESADLSKSFVSQIESGSANPSIASLKRITDALEVPLGVLFEPDDEADGARDSVAARDEVRVVRRHRRKMIRFPGRKSSSYLLTPDLQRRLEVILEVQDPEGEDGQEELYSHDGEEFGFVLEGRYEVTVDEETFVLEEGDSIAYPSHRPHAMRALAPGTRTIWVVTPPSF
jgi:transcriptional regulator with XRE-family HTH domain